MLRLAYTFKNKNCCSYASIVIWIKSESCKLESFRETGRRIFVTFVRRQVSCFPPFPVLILLYFIPVLQIQQI